MHRVGGGNPLTAGGWMEKRIVNDTNIPNQTNQRPPPFLKMETAFKANKDISYIFNPFFLSFFCVSLNFNKGQKRSNSAGRKILLITINNQEKSLSVSYLPLLLYTCICMCVYEVKYSDTPLKRPTFKVQ